MCYHTLQAPLWNVRPSNRETYERKGEMFRSKKQITSFQMIIFLDRLSTFCVFKIINHFNTNCKGLILKSVHYPPIQPFPILQFSALWDECRKSYKNSLKKRFIYSGEQCHPRDSHYFRYRNVAKRDLDCNICKGTLCIGCSMRLSLW